MRPVDGHSRVALELIETLYEGAVDEAAWSHFLRRLATASQAIVPGLHLISRATDQPLFVVEPEVEPGWRRAFEQYFVKLDLRRPRIQALPEGSVFRGQDVLPDSELTRSEF